MLSKITDAKICQAQESDYWLYPEPVINLVESTDILKFVLLKFEHKSVLSILLTIGKTKIFTHIQNAICENCRYKNYHCASPDLIALNDYGVELYQSLEILPCQNCKKSLFRRQVLWYPKIPDNFCGTHNKGLT